MKHFFYLSVFLLHVPFAFSSLSMDHQLSDHEKVDDQLSVNQEEAMEPASKNIVIAEAVAEDGATARVIAKNPVKVKNAICFLYGKGFRPNENLKIASTSCCEALSFEIQADNKGEFFAGLAPEVSEKSGGVCHIDILREFVDAPLHLKYPWGSEVIFTNQSD